MYPEIDSFFDYNNKKEKNNKIDFKNLKEPEKISCYPFGTREKFMKKLIENPAVIWSGENDLSFKNNRR